MNWQETVKDWNECNKEEHIPPAYELDKSLVLRRLREQAEISFKAGFSEVVKWVDESSVAMTFETRLLWQAFKEELRQELPKEL